MMYYHSHVSSRDNEISLNQGILVTGGIQSSDSVSNFVTGELNYRCLNSGMPGPCAACNPA